MTETAKKRLALIPGTVLGAWALAVLWLGSDAGYSITAFLVSEVGGLLLLGWWLTRLVLWVAKRRKHPGHAPRMTGRPVLRWAWEPMTVVTCAAIALTGIGFPARFALSRSALDRYAQQVRERGDSMPPAGQVVGLFKLREVELLPGGVVRLITTSCMMDDCGLVHSPIGRPPVVGEDAYTRLSGDWWHWFRSW